MLFPDEPLEVGPTLPEALRQPLADETIPVGRPRGTGTSPVQRANEPPWLPI